MGSEIIRWYNRILARIDYSSLLVPKTFNFATLKLHFSGKPKQIAVY